MSQGTHIRYGRTLAAYELQRMLDDSRTNRYGEAWCRKKVTELFGPGCFMVQPANRLSLEMQDEALQES